MDALPPAIGTDPAPAPPSARRGGPWPWWLIPAAALAAVVTFGLPVPFNLALPGLAALALLGAWLVRSPAPFAAAVPALLPLPQFLKVFAYELALLVLVAALVYAGWRTRARWLSVLDPIETWVWALLGWAVITGLWVRDPWWYMFGVRKMLIGALALWAARRVARQVGSEAMFREITVTMVALALYVLALAAARGGLAEIDVAARNRVTDLGWGRSNFLAALLVMMLPGVLHLALHASSRGLRALAWSALPLSALVMGVAASRGGTLLLLLVTVLFVAGERRGRGSWLALGGLGAVAAILAASPVGPRLLERFTDVKELGSIVIRLWYFREAWGRFLDHLPLGMGLGQGYIYPDRLMYNDPHNYWLVVGPELGLPGLVLWVGVIVALWRGASRLARDPAARSAGRALQFTIVITQLNSLFEPTFQGLQYQFLFYWIVGAYLGGFGVRDSAPWTSSRSSSTATTPARM